MAFNIVIEIIQKDLAISVSYIKKNITLEDIHSGFWYNNEIKLDQIMSQFINYDDWHVLEESMGHWVNDDFNMSLPFKLTRNINEFREGILKTPEVETYLNLKIDLADNIIQ